MEITENEYRRLLDQSVMGAGPDDRARFWSHVTKLTDCWLYAPVSQRMYGQFNCFGRTYPAHRVSLIWAVGAPEISLFACHLCKNKSCVRPSHLYFGTPKQNSQDRFRDKTDQSGEMSPHAKITEKTVEKIRDLAQTKSISSGSIALQLGVSKTIVKQVLSGRTWRSDARPVGRGLKGIKKEYGLSGHPNRRLHEEEVLDIRRRLAAGETGRVLAKEYQVTTGMISAIKLRRAWVNLVNEQTGLIPEKIKRHILTIWEVAQIKKELQKSEGKHGVGAEIARKYNVSKTSIIEIKNGNSYASVMPAE